MRFREDRYTFGMTNPEYPEQIRGRLGTGIVPVKLKPDPFVFGLLIPAQLGLDKQFSHAWSMSQCNEKFR